MTSLLSRVEPEHAVPSSSADLASPALRRLEELVDAGSLHVAVLADGVVTGHGRVCGVRTAVFATDPSTRAGALGAAGCRSVAESIRGALRDGSPVVGVWHSAGARVQEGVASLDGMGQVFAASTAASGRVPLIAVVLGTSAGGAAYGPALADVVITGPGARLFVTGPGVVQEVTGEDVDAATLGGPEVHERRSGLAHVTADSDADAFRAARRVTRLLARPHGRPRRAIAQDTSLRTALPERRRQAYDVRPLVRKLLDVQCPTVELHPRWAPNVVTVLGRLDGLSVGVVANNPLRLAGCLDAPSSEKAARFVRMCDALGLPLVVVVDVPGFLPGAAQEWSGVVRRGAKLLHAFAEASVPRVTLVTHKAYGGAYIAMNSRSLGASAVLAWPTAEIAVMGAEAAARVLHRKALDSLPVQRRAERLAELACESTSPSGLEQACALGLVDAVIDPADTRRELAAALARAAPRRGRHGNIPL